MQNENYKAIISMAKVYEISGESPESIDAMFSGFPERKKRHAIANYKKELMTEVINGTWTPDWSDKQQQRWFVWMWVNKKSDGSAGVGLSLLGVYFVTSVAFVGARHVFETEEQAAHSFEYFPDVYEEYYASAQF